MNNMRKLINLMEGVDSANMGNLTNGDNKIADMVQKYKNDQISYEELMDFLTSGPIENAPVDDFDDSDDDSYNDWAMHQGEQGRHSPAVAESGSSTEDPLVSKMKARAKEESKNGYAQHVNMSPAGYPYISDWYDSDETIASYEFGKPTGISAGEMDETAPPGMEDVVMKLKKEYPGHPEKAFATAWSIYNKKHSNVDEAKSDKYFAPRDELNPDDVDNTDTEALRQIVISDIHEFIDIARSNRETPTDHINYDSQSADNFTNIVNSNDEQLKRAYGAIRRASEESPERFIKTAQSALKLLGSTVDEAFDLNNGYGKNYYANGSDYFPNGADGPLVNRTGPSGARHGDNPEQKKMQVAEVHKELVYGYRKFLDESKDPCWDGYKQVGTKKKNGKQVPNCVPKK